MALQPPVPPGPPPMGPPPTGGRISAMPPPPGSLPPPGIPGAPGAPPVAGQQAEEPEDHLPHPGFFQLPWVQNLLPFLTSLLAHGVLAVVAIVFAKVVYEKIIPPPAEKEQTIIPEAQLAENEPPGGIPNQGPNNDPFEKVMQNATPEGAKPDGWASKAGPAVEMQAAGAAGDTEGADSIANGPGSLLGGGGAAGGTGKGDGSGPLAQFGLRSGGGAIGPHGPVFGHGGNARKVIFVCDATGSMLNKMPTLKQQLENAIHDLKPIQSFNVIFFYDGPKLLACDPEHMIMATPANQQKAQAFLDNVTPTGQTDPFPALELAFRQQPELLYLLSDGGLDDNLRTNPEVLTEIGKLEAGCGNKVHINTIMFDEDSQSGREVLTQIAKEHGGHYLFVKESDLNR